MDSSGIDWDSLERLRGRFLSTDAPDGPYWTSESELSSYDRTFGARIGWKWDAVLDDVCARGWSPPQGDVLDWGCGSGIAGRRILNRFGEDRFRSLVLWDHSPLAVDYAQSAARRECDGLSIAAATQAYLDGDDPIGLLVLSHVLNELPEEALQQVRRLVLRSQAVVWTEPGSCDTGRKLSGLRNEFLADFGIVAPCTHKHSCPAIADGNDRDWCHHFAAPPPGIFADSGWVTFGKRAGIDLRSLPYSFLALDRSWPTPEAGLSRIIGRPEAFKPYVRLLSCDESGLSTLEVPRRTNAPLCKELEKARGPLVYKWSREGGRVLSGERARGISA